MFTDDALKQYNEIEEDWNQAKGIGAYVGRYMNYLVAFSDLMLVSKAFGEVETNVHQISKLVDLVKLVKLVDSVEVCLKELESTNEEYSTNATNLTNEIMFVQKKHVEKAWAIIKPCLELAIEIVSYVDMGKALAKTREYIKKFNGEKVYHSDLMRMSNLSAKEVEEAIKTLSNGEREEIEKGHDDVTRKNNTVVAKLWYRWKVD